MAAMKYIISLSVLFAASLAPGIGTQVQPDDGEGEFFFSETKATLEEIIFVDGVTLSLGLPGKTNACYECIAASMRSAAELDPENGDAFSTLTALLFLKEARPEHVSEEVGRLPYSVLITREGFVTIRHLLSFNMGFAGKDENQPEKLQAVRDRLMKRYEMHASDSESHRLLRLVYELENGNAYLRFSCRSLCTARHLFRLLAGTQSAVETDSLVRLEEKMAGIPCSDCLDGVYRATRRDKSIEFLGHSKVYFAKEEFIEREARNWNHLQMSDNIVPYEFQDLLTELTLCHIEGVDLRILDRKMRELPTRVLIDPDLRAWMMGIPNSDRNWMTGRSRLVEDLMYERFRETASEEEARHLLELAIRLANFEGDIQTDPGRACDAYCRAANYLREWRFDDLPPANFEDKLAAKLAGCGGCPPE